MPEEQTQAEKSLKIEILEKMTDLATAGFGLVAALAWNDAIKLFFETVFQKTGGIIAQFAYAIIITVIIVIITLKLGKITDLAKKQLVKKGQNDQNS